MSQLRPITTVVTDILGSTLNKHCTALRQPFSNAFEQFGIPITNYEVNKPTCIRKDEHIREILNMPDVMHRFEANKKRKVDFDQDTKAIFKLYEPLQIEQELKEMKIKAVATTGFKSNMTRVVFANSEEQIGQFFDDVISRVKRGRPHADMVWAAMISASCVHPQSCITFDDTGPKIMSGISAGTKTMAVMRYNTFTGLFTNDTDLLEKTNPKEYLQLLRESWKHIEEFKPTYICQTFEGLLPLIKLYNSNLCAHA